MSIVVWDGVTLATDRAGTDGSALWKSTKAWYWGQEILSGAGHLQSILEMREWYKSGAKHEEFPAIQVTNPCHFLVVNQQGLRRYEAGPIPIHHGASMCAFGSGKDFAYGALGMGATAEQAVEVANKFSAHCGLGVARYSVGGGNGTES